MTFIDVVFKLAAPGFSVSSSLFDGSEADASESAKFVFGAEELGENDGVDAVANSGVSDQLRSFDRALVVGRMFDPPCGKRCACRMSFTGGAGGDGTDEASKVDEENETAEASEVGEEGGR